MSANVESMFSVRQMPWHQEGTVLAGLPRRLGAGPHARRTGLGPGHHRGLRDHRHQPRRHRALRAHRGLEVHRPLRHRSHPVPEQGHLHRHRPRARWARSSRRSWPSPTSRWETAGVLDGGRSVWCLALLDEPITLPGDDSPTLPYLAITNRHDGTAACALRATAVRIVCANTFRAAELEGERTGATFSFIHKSSWRNRIDEARQAVTGAQAEMRRYAELAAELLAIRITPAQRELFITEFIPKPPEGLITDRVARNVDEARAALRMIFETKTTEHVADTAYGLVQAAGEYLDHVRTARTWETRLNRTLIRPEPLKHRALVPGPGHHHHDLTQTVPGLGDCHPPARPARTIPYLAKDKGASACPTLPAPCPRA